jgi:hypothetical protein
MHKLTNWTAKRAGARMTVYGKDENGAEAKIVGVDRVERFQPDNGTARLTIAVRDHVSPPEFFQLAD